MKLLVPSIVVGMFIGWGFTNIMSSYVITDPYDNVKLVRKIVRDDTVELIYNFVKLGCTRERFEVFTSDGETFSETSYTDIEPPAYLDRTAGKQTLSISVTIDSNTKEVELRTRHNCSGRIIDKVFDKQEIQ